MYTPFVPDKPQQAQATKQDDEESGNAKITGTIQKEIVDTIKENGLPSDVDAFISQVDSFLGNSSSIFSLGGNKPREYTMAELMRVQSMANRVAFNNTAYQKAAAHLTQENAWSEVATDSNGRMYVVTEEGIKLINPGEFDQESMNALTNKQVMDLRANNQELAFNNDMLTSTNGAVSMTSIVNHLKGVISNFGTNSSTGYSVKVRDQIEQGLQELIQLGPEGFYKVLHETKGSGRSDSGVMEAMNYLVGTLDANMRNLLRAKTAAEGKNPNNAIDVYSIVGQALTQHTGEKISVDYDSVATKAVMGDSNSGSTEKMENLTLAQKMARGKGPERKETTIRPDGQTDITFITQDFGIFQNRQLDFLEESNLKELLKDAEQLKAARRNSMYFGDQKVSENESNLVVWDGNSSVKRVNMPVIKDDDGSYRPMFEMYKALDDFNNWVDSNPNVSANEINNELYRRTHGYAIWNPETKQAEFSDSIKPGSRGYDPNSKVTIMPVAMFEGYMSRNSNTITDKHSKWMHQLKGDLDRGEIKNIRDTYEILAKRGSLSFSKNDQSGVGKVNAGNIRKMYRAPIFIVMNPELGDVLTGPDYEPQSQYYNRQGYIESVKQSRQMKLNFDE